jgi:hypothetical protein
MAKRIEPSPGSWLRVEEFIENGDPEFVTELRRIHDAERLGNFAKVLYNDTRTATRRSMLLYLQAPFNAFRHEALLKRLFKLAEAAKDDEVMACFMVGLDRSIRREKRSRNRYDWSTRESWVEEHVVTPRGTEMPKKGNPFIYQNRITGEPMAAPTPEKNGRVFLFKLATRKYLRRRVWRYFRQLGKSDLYRYATGISKALVQYTDKDCKDGLAMLDNWSLVQALFKHSDVIVSKSRTWKLAEGRSLSELRAAPAYASAWHKEAEPLMSMLDLASCRPVRQWSMGMLREHHAKALSQTSLDRLLRWIRSEDAELARFGAELFSQSNLLGSVQPKTWLQLIHQANPDVLDIVCRLVMKTLTADNVSLREAMELACSRSVPLAELGMAWLESMQPHSDQDFQDLLLSLDAESEHIRPKLVDQVRRKLDRVASKRSQWILEYLDSRFPDVRDVGWTWLQERTEVARDYHLWQRLIETPYDDLRLKVIELLQYESIPTHSKAGQSMLIDAKRLSPEGIRFLWATALLNIHRGGKQKPGVVKAMIGRLHAHREEANDLLPILAVALRSIRTTEWQAGLAGIVTWIEKNPDVSDMVQAHFPELNLI